MKDYVNKNGILGNVTADDKLVNDLLNRFVGFVDENAERAVSTFRVINNKT